MKTEIRNITTYRTPADKISVFNISSVERPLRYAAVSLHDICVVDIDPIAYGTTAELLQLSTVKITVKSNYMFTKEFDKTASLYKKLKACFALQQRYVPFVARPVPLGDNELLLGVL